MPSGSCCQHLLPFANAHNPPGVLYIICPEQNLNLTSISLSHRKLGDDELLSCRHLDTWFALLHYSKNSTLLVILSLPLVSRDWSVVSSFHVHHYVPKSVLSIQYSLSALFLSYRNHECGLQTVMKKICW